MNKIVLLIVDNDPTMAKIIAERLEPLGSAKLCYSEADAFEILAQHEIHCALLDLDLRSGKKRGERVLEGITLGEKIRRRWPHVGILMYSTLIDSRRSDTTELVAAGKAAGAHEVFSRERCLIGPVPTLVGFIEAAIAAVKPADCRVVFSPSYRMNAVLELYGQENLRGLLRKLKPSYQFYWIKALQAGFSGAAVLHVRASNREDGGGSVEWILKIATSRQPLELEISRRPVLGSITDHTGVAAYDSEVASSGERTHGFRTRFVSGMRLLRDYLKEPGLDSAVEAVLTGVVDKLLIPPLNSAGGAVPEFTLRASMGVDLIDFLREAENWTSVLRPEDIAAVTATRRLVETTLDNDGRLPWASGVAAQLHGDFHSANVFVAENSDPKCIDFARQDTFPRFFDFAALDVDLTLGPPAARVGEELTWNKMNDWKQQRTALFPFTDVSLVATDSRVERLRHLMLNGIRSAGGTPAEYIHVLAFHYWRYLRFPNVSSPKKILACHLIAELGRVTGTAVI